MTTYESMLQFIAENYDLSDWNKTGEDSPYYISKLIQENLASIVRTVANERLYPVVDVVDCPSYFTLSNDSQMYTFEVHENGYTKLVSTKMGANDFAAEQIALSDSALDIFQVYGMTVTYDMMGKVEPDFQGMCRLWVEPYAADKQTPPVREEFGEYLRDYESGDIMVFASYQAADEYGMKNCPAYLDFVICSASPFDV